MRTSQVVWLLACILGGRALAEPTPPDEPEPVAPGQSEIPPPGDDAYSAPGPDMPRSEAPRQGSPASSGEAASSRDSSSATTTEAPPIQSFGAGEVLQGGLLSSTPLDEPGVERSPVLIGASSVSSPSVPETGPGRSPSPPVLGASIAALTLYQLHTEVYGVRLLLERQHLLSFAPKEIDDARTLAETLLSEVSSDTLLRPLASEISAQIQRLKDLAATPDPPAMMQRVLEIERLLTAMRTAMGT